MSDLSMMTEDQEISIADRVYDRIIETLGAGVSKECDQSLVMLTREDIARYLKTTVQNVAKLQEFGAIKAMLIGKRYLTPRSEMERFYRDYRGLDLSNSYRIKEAVKIVNERKG